MTLTIEVPPDVEQALAATAARLGVPVERYAAGVLQRDVERNDVESNNARQERKVRRLGALEAAVETARGFAGAPGVLAAPLSDWTLSRAGAYDAAE